MAAPEIAIAMTESAPDTKNVTDELLSGLMPNFTLTSRIELNHPVWTTIR